MVRLEGLEPPRISPPEPKSGVSANFTTAAFDYYNIKLATLSTIEFKSISLISYISLRSPDCPKLFTPKGIIFCPFTDPIQDKELE